jgi:hypothetical protein
MRTSDGSAEPGVSSVDAIPSRWQFPLNLLGPRLFDRVQPPVSERILTVEVSFGSHLKKYLSEFDGVMTFAKECLQLLGIDHGADLVRRVRRRRVREIDASSRDEPARA